VFFDEIGLAELSPLNPNKVKYFKHPSLVAFA